MNPRLVHVTLPATVLAVALLAGAPCVAKAAAGPPAAAAFATASADGDLPAVEDVLARFVAAVGGRDAVLAVGARHYRGRIVQDLSWRRPTHEETAFVAEAHPDGRVRYAEAAAWSALDTATAGDLQDELRWLLHPRQALVVEEFFPGLSVAGREVRDGRRVVVLAPRDRAYAYHALYFDEESGLLTHIGYHDQVGDWRAEGGVLVPHEVVFGRKGGHTTYRLVDVAPGPAPRAP